MKIAIINTWNGGAVHNIMYPLSLELSKRGHECDYITRRQIEITSNFDLSFSSYDIVHVGYFMNLNFIFQDIEVPYTCNVHHIPHEHLNRYAGDLYKWSPAEIVVSDPFAARQLGQVGIYNTTEIPYSFDHSPYKLLPYPDEFTIGYLGCDYNIKRFDVIQAAAFKAKVKSNGIARKTLNEEENFKNHSDILDLYKNISCYIVASFNDGGPLPPQEALLCGRPVLTTKVGMMPQIISHGYNGLYHNGSVEGITSSILEAKREFDKLKHGAQATTLPSVEETTTLYERLFEKVVNNEA